MKIQGLIPIALGALALVGVAYALDVVPTQQHEAAVAREMAGGWKKNVELTRQLDPDRSVWNLETLNFTADTQVSRQIPTSITALRGRTVIASGSLIMDGKSYPYVIGTGNGSTALVWWLPGKESPFGEPKVAIVNLALARNHASDLLFLGGDDGARDATVCFTRSAR